MQSKSKTKTIHPNDAKGVRNYKGLKHAEEDTQNNLHFEKLISRTFR